jgi:hypothetical protein
MQWLEVNPKNGSWIDPNAYVGLFFVAQNK